MNEDINQKISCFIDNEIKSDAALDLFKKIQSQPELKDKINRYQVASFAISNEHVLPIKADFLAGIQQGIEKEPTYLLPPRSRAKPSRQTVTALAACVALVAILAVNMSDKKPNTEKLNTLSISTVPPIKKQLTPPAQKSIIKVAFKQPTKQIQNTHQNNRFNDYLQAHNTSRYTNGTATFQPHVQTVSYKQD